MTEIVRVAYCWVFMRCQYFFGEFPSMKLPIGEQRLSLSWRHKGLASYRKETYMYKTYLVAVIFVFPFSLTYTVGAVGCRFLESLCTWNGLCNMIRWIQESRDEIRTHRVPKALLHSVGALSLAEFLHSTCFCTGRRGWRGLAALNELAVGLPQYLCLFAYVWCSHWLHDFRVSETAIAITYRNSSWSGATHSYDLGLVQLKLLSTGFLRLKVLQSTQDASEMLLIIQLQVCGGRQWRPVINMRKPTLPFLTLHYTVLLYFMLSYLA